VDEYLYVGADLRRVGSFADAALAGATERHHLRLSTPVLHDVADPARELLRPGVHGMVLELAAGLPTTSQLELLSAASRARGRAWIYWPAEEAVERVDAERLESLRQHVTRVKWLKRICLPIDAAITRWNRVPTALRWVYRGEFPVRRSDIDIRLTLAALRAQPLPLADLSGAGVYLRSDYWGPENGDPRARHVVASLARTASPLVCLTAARDEQLDGCRVRQVPMDRPRRTGGEDAIVLAPAHYAPIVKAACQTITPAFVYERLALGQSAGAEVCQALSIPYIVEYPGGDALVREAIGSRAPFYPELYLRAEELALRQAVVVVVASAAARDEVCARGIDAARVVVVSGEGEAVADAVASALEALRHRAVRAARIETGDAYKDQVQNQWNQNPVGSQHARESQPHTLEWFLEIERHRYGTYAPWMPEAMEFGRHGGEDVLEIGGGIGTDLAQFAMHGARVTDVDLAAGHLQLAEENFRLRKLSGTFVHHDAESLPFADASFDLVYSNGVLHHTPNTVAVVREIRRVLRPGGRAIVMLYAENSFHYWRKQVWLYGIKDGLLDRQSMAEIMSSKVERSANEAKPLVKVYTPARAAALFDGFERLEILQRQLEAFELPALLRRWRAEIERRYGWNLIVKASKPR
jgi:ubiquinone/menaquinone biosynthesis C-methylase UbiE